MPRLRRSLSKTDGGEKQSTSNDSPEKKSAKSSESSGEPRRPSLPLTVPKETRSDPSSDLDPPMSPVLGLVPENTLANLFESPLHGFGVQVQKKQNGTVPSVVCRLCEESIPVDVIDDHHQKCAVAQAQNMQAFQEQALDRTQQNAPPTQPSLKKLQSLKGLLARLRAKNSKTEEVPEMFKEVLSVESFQVLKPISKGGFGRVYLAKKKATGDIYALKAMKKADLISGQMMDNVIVERDILAATSNPFVVELMYAFDDREHLYLVMEFMVGGDCGSLLKGFGIFDENMTRCYLAETVLALEYLHELGIIHRDLKPDNMLITATGHIKLTDFGLSGIGGHQHSHKKRNCHHTPRKVPDLLNPRVRESLHISRGAAEKWNNGRLIGTPDYLAPEVLRHDKNEKHGVGPPSDWWALGIVAFEFLTGLPPFLAEEVDTVFENILTGDIPWPDVPEEMSAEAADFIKNLLNPVIAERLGTGAHGPKRIKTHEFFSSVGWSGLHNEDRSEIFVPNPDDAVDTGYFDEERMALLGGSQPSFAVVDVDGKNVEKAPVRRKQSVDRVESARFAFTNTKSLMRKNMEAAFEGKEKQLHASDTNLRAALDKVDRFAETTLNFHTSLTRRESEDGDQLQHLHPDTRKQFASSKNRRVLSRSDTSLPNEGRPKRGPKKAAGKELLPSDSLPPSGASEDRAQPARSRSRSFGSRGARSRRGSVRSETAITTPVPTAEQMRDRIEQLPEEELRDLVASLVEHYPWAHDAAVEKLYPSHQQAESCIVCHSSFTHDRNFLGACPRHPGELTQRGPQDPNDENSESVWTYLCCGKTYAESKGCKFGQHRTEHSSSRSSLLAADTVSRGSRGSRGSKGSKGSSSSKRSLHKRTASAGYLGHSPILDSNPVRVFPPKSKKKDKKDKKAKKLVRGWTDDPAYHRDSRRNSTHTHSTQSPRGSVDEGRREKPRRRRSKFRLFGSSMSDDDFNAADHPVGDIPRRVPSEPLW